MIRARLISLQKLGLNTCKGSSRSLSALLATVRGCELQRNTDAARPELDGPVQCRRFRTRDLPEATITTAAVAAALTTTTLTSAVSASAVSSSALTIASVTPSLAAAALATSIAALATT